MPEFTNADRCMIEMECRMWTIRQMLVDAEDNCGGWNDRVRKLRIDAQKLAQELRDYNDQFECNED